MKELRGYNLLAVDGTIGKVHWFYFDDRMWEVRYLVADTGKWLAGRLILLSPEALDQPDWEERTVPVQLTREQIEKSPGIDKKQPVHRQNELALMKYYNWPDYWSSMDPQVPVSAVAIQAYHREAVGSSNEMSLDGDQNPYLRSTREVNGYHIHTPTGTIGHVDDFILDDQSWSIRYLIVDTSNWMPFSKKVLLSRQWIERIDWSKETVFVDLDKEVIENSPSFDPSDPVNRRYEARLYDYYGRPKYWETEVL